MSAAEREEIPAALGRAIAVAKEFNIVKFGMTPDYLDQAQRQLTPSGSGLDGQQLLALCQVGLTFDHDKLVWTATSAGLPLGGPAEAQFLLYRAQIAPGYTDNRSAVLAAAALALAQFHGDSAVIDEAAEMLRDDFMDDPLKLTLDQAREVIRREIGSPAYPSLSTKGPDYSDFAPKRACDCPKCRARRGEFVDFDDDDDDFDEEDEFDFEEELRTPKNFDEMIARYKPDDFPEEIGKPITDILRKAFLNGDTPEQAMQRMLNELQKLNPPPPPKKGRSR